MPVVTGIRVEWSSDRSHQHIVGVWTSEGMYRTNRQVADSLSRGERWSSTAGGAHIPISWIRWCPAMNCHEGPYLISVGPNQRHIPTGLHLIANARSADCLENLPSGGPRPIGSDRQPEGEGGGLEPATTAAGGGGQPAQGEGEGAPAGSGG